MSELIWQSPNGKYFLTDNGKYAAWWVRNGNKVERYILNYPSPVHQ